MDAFKHCPIDLNEQQVIEFTRQAIGEVLEAWEMEYDDEPRDDLKTAGTLLDLHWKAPQARKEQEAHAAFLANRREAEGTDLPDEDARLSAAAPDLLRAVARYTEIVDAADSMDFTAFVEELEEVRSDARTAIAKATAEEVKP
jgi:hypothetical protein